MFPLRASGRALGCLSPASAGCSQALLSLACRCRTLLCFHHHVTSSCIAAFISLVALLRGTLATGLWTTQIRYDQITVNYTYGRFSSVYTLRQVVDVNFGDYIIQPAPEAHCRSIGELWWHLQCKWCLWRVVRVEDTTQACSVWIGQRWSWECFVWNWLCERNWGNLVLSLLPKDLEGWNDLRLREER